MFNKFIAGVLGAVIMGGTMFGAMESNISELESVIEDKENELDLTKEQKEDLARYIKELHEEQYKLQQKLEKEKKAKEKLEKTKQSNQVKKKKSNNSAQGKQLGNFVATAYCDIPADQEQWVGKTATGFSLAGKSRTDAMCIAVDPNVIPLGSKVRMTFGSGMEKYNGVYTAYDVGGGVKGNHIDVFMGGAESQDEMYHFGRRNVQVEILQ